MNLVAWVVFVGLLIEAGAVLMSYLLSLQNPEGAKNLYLGLNLFDIMQFSQAAYAASIAFYVLILLLKAFAALIVVRLLSSINIDHPFSQEVVALILKISRIILVAAAVVLLQRAFAFWLSEQNLQLESTSPDGFLFLAGVIYVISQLFKKGVEMQTENGLTI